VLPAASLARTWNWCVPTPSPVYVVGDVQAAKAAVSRAHSNVAPASLEKVNVALVLVVVAGGLSPIVVSGAVVSTVIARLAGLMSVLPAAYVARTSKVWAPSVSAAVVCGEVQAAKGAASTRHWKLEPGSLEIAYVGVLSVVGPESIVVCGAVVSTVIARLAGLPSTYPAASLARTSKVCAPSARTAVVCGDVQAVKAPVSTRHWKLAPGSLEKPYVGVESLVSPLGRNASDGTVRRPRRDGRGGEGPRRER
jgi:hypothetical protein